MRKQALGARPAAAFGPKQLGRAFRLQKQAVLPRFAAMSQWSSRRIGFSIWGISAALVVLLLSVEPALGAGRQSVGKHQPQDNRQSQEKAARKACLTGDYNNGVSILADLFVEDREPVYVFNQGRCLEQNSRFKDAIARFEEYLRIGETAKLDPADRTAAQKHIEDCKAKLSDEDKAQVAANQPLVQPLPQPAAQPVPQPDATTRIALAPKAEPAQSGKGLLVGGIVTGAVGVAAVVAGIAFNLKSNSLMDEMQTTVDGYTSDKNSSQKSYQTMAWVGYGVGAACIATGAVLIAVGASRRGSSSQTDVALVPTVGPGQAGVLLRGGF